MVFLDSPYRETPKNVLKKIKKKIVRVGWFLKSLSNIRRGPVFFFECSCKTEVGGRNRQEWHLDRSWDDDDEEGGEQLQGIGALLALAAKGQVAPVAVGGGQVIKIKVGREQAGLAVCCVLGYLGLGLANPPPPPPPSVFGVSPAASPPPLPSVFRVLIGGETCVWVKKRNPGDDSQVSSSLCSFCGGRTGPALVFRA
jgi:hypothetical protein